MSYYDQVRIPTGSGWNNVKGTFEDVSRLTGMPLHILQGLGGAESGYRNIKNFQKGQSAAGMTQIIDSTWRNGMARYGRSLGIPANATQYDPRANLLMTAALYKNEYLPVIQRAGRTPTVGDVYAIHFLGGRDYAKFARALKNNPNGSVADYLPSYVMRANTGYLYRNGRPSTNQELYDLLTAKLSKHSGQSKGSGYISLEGKSTGSKKAPVNTNSSLAPQQFTDAPVISQRTSGKPRVDLSSFYQPIDNYAAVGSSDILNSIGTPSVNLLSGNSSGLLTNIYEDPEETPSIYNQNNLLT